MTTDEIRALEPNSRRRLKHFADCFAERAGFDYFVSYSLALLTRFERKSIEPIALWISAAVWTLQEFLSHFVWDHQQVETRFRRMIVDEHGSENAIGVIDGPAHAKQGKKTPGVQRQYCGESGMMDNCVVGQHLIYANNDPTNPFSGCIASDVYLPECWVNDPALMRWPGHIPAGKGCDAPLMTIDMLPTIARLIGGRLPDHKIDGLDISDVILGKSVNSPHAVLWFDYGSNNLEALRSGKWKLELPRRDSSLNGRPGGRGGIPAKYEMLTIAFPSKVACGEPPLAIRLDSQYLGCG